MLLKPHDDSLAASSFRKKKKHSHPRHFSHRHDVDDEDEDDDLRRDTYIYSYQNMMMMMTVASLARREFIISKEEMPEFKMKVAAVNSGIQLKRFNLWPMKRLLGKAKCLDMDLSTIGVGGI